ncbi:MAG: nucleotide exchange factor GrpE [Phenylobacterium sp.]
MADETPPARETPKVFEGIDSTDDVDAVRAENAALKEQVLRYAADAENTKRRAEREANDARAYAIQKFARDLLGVADNLTRALAHAPADTEDQVVKNFVLGIELTDKELQQAFERNGLKRLAPARGDKFNPHQHQAMAEAPGTDVAPGGVVEVMQAGYELLGRLVRPAMVIVAAKAPGAAPEAAKANGTQNPYGEAAADESGDEAGGSVDTRA